MSLLHQSKKYLFILLSLLALILGVTPSVYANDMYYWTPNGYVPYSEFNKYLNSDSASTFSLLDNDPRLPSYNERVVLLNQYNSLRSAVNSSFEPISTDILSFESHYCMWMVPRSYVMNYNGYAFYDSEGNAVDMYECNVDYLYYLAIYGGDNLLDESTLTYDEYESLKSTSVSVGALGPGEFLISSSSHNVYYWCTFYISIDGVTWRNPYYINSVSNEQQYSSFYESRDSREFTAKSNTQGIALFSDINVGRWTSDELFEAKHPAKPLPDDCLNGLNLAGGSTDDGGADDGTTDDGNTDDGSGGTSGGDTSGDDATLTEDEKDKNIIASALSFVFGSWFRYMENGINSFVNIWESVGNVLDILVELLTSKLDWLTIGYLKDYLIFALYLVVILIIVAWLPFF